MEIHEQLETGLKRLHLAKSRKPGTYVRLTQQFLIQVCDLALPVFKNEKFILKLSAPIHVVGDIHGQFYDLLRMFDLIGLPTNEKFLFLGDYVDRGTQSIEVVTLLFLYKILYPDNIFLLRGNHETAEINENQGFKAECTSRYSHRLWLAFNEVFKYLPIGAVIGDKIFAVHGGISPEVTDLSFFDSVERPIASPVGAILDYMVSDPDPYKLKWDKKPRGASYVYGAPQIHEFLDANNLEVLVRGHEMVEDGFEFPFEPDRCTVTVFSAPYGQSNKGAVMNIDQNYCCTFTEIPPLERRIGRGRNSILDDILAPMTSLSKSLPKKTW
ncbi:Ser/Thr protein phosphatase, putative [Trichomonas vaginalis G3]|uniref:Serine/threonine-protein phosphatase n=1 Tax=Trichomonas vaginalis (strain ATCC PRA-98 / G3) TaxID=412133 RepID=A2FUH7_TRIV3|nr:serine/threonine protein phosphatase family [Trichomonas vaginalis G3]EAX91442.1 Ser/Thr protein phosphatase, putative [Trichomonas vaginalis G3]KAI5503512.1 serine/threonine protein phosphatase family [Trichomonas vaginalis G3]|eukprot:XP_001304372.1 Ser/Thr protein phosphatase [Trichomonas vaginalis G3]